jgi:hypothetical protein
MKRFSTNGARTGQRKRAALIAWGLALQGTEVHRSYPFVVKAQLTIGKAVS